MPHQGGMSILALDPDTQDDLQPCIHTRGGGDSEPPATDLTLTWHAIVYIVYIS